MRSATSSMRSIRMFRRARTSLGSWPSSVPTSALRLCRIRRSHGRSPNSTGSNTRRSGRSRWLPDSADLDPTTLSATERTACALILEATGSGHSNASSGTAPSGRTSHRGLRNGFALSTRQRQGPPSGAMHFAGPRSMRAQRLTRRSRSRPAHGPTSPKLRCPPGESAGS